MNQSENPENLPPIKDFYTREDVGKHFWDAWLKYPVEIIEDAGRYMPMIDISNRPEIEGPDYSIAQRAMQTLPPFYLTGKERRQWQRDKKQEEAERRDWYKKNPEGYWGDSEQGQKWERKWAEHKEKDRKWNEEQDKLPYEERETTKWLARFDAWEENNPVQPRHFDDPAHTLPLAKDVWDDEDVGKYFWDDEGECVVLVLRFEDEIVNYDVPDPEADGKAE